ncbi:hypothetical protein THRCLA_02611 [Thraustotheca clavata]|uniref:Anaphase-promoting complex subunit 4 n=1 Tax=Thraustotheca clavata TaxID=74557 RepID=A0A1W0A4I6_9STRA|nr:hypothetical protein THRCLA_02611 [Thraustotheca clavata]
MSAKGGSRWSQRRNERQKTFYHINHNLINSKVELTKDEIASYVEFTRNKCQAQFGVVKLAKYNLNVLCTTYQGSMPLVRFATLHSPNIALALFYAGADPSFHHRKKDDIATFPNARDCLMQYPPPYMAWLLLLLTTLSRQESECQDCHQVVSTMQLDPCQHQICELCFWKQLSTMRIDQDIVCPCCKELLDCPNAPCTIQNASHNKITPKDIAATSKEEYLKLPLVPRKGIKSEKVSKLVKPLPLYNAVELFVGATQSQRDANMYKAVLDNNCSRLRALINAGVNIDCQNEYGQSPLYVAAWLGYERVVKYLLDSGASPELKDNAKTLPLEAAIAHNHTAVVSLLQPFSKDHYDDFNPQWCTMPPSKAHFNTLIPSDAAHPGAGSGYWDDLFPESFLHRLEHLFSQLPSAPREKASCSNRSYYCDSLGWVMAQIHQRTGRKVFPNMRFLHYDQIGGSLPAHTDLSRTDAHGVTSTTTFIIYLSTCPSGGETNLLSSMAPDRTVIAPVHPKRGRLLIFPHICPHEGGVVSDVPKLLLRVLQDKTLSAKEIACCPTMDIVAVLTLDAQLLRSVSWQRLLHVKPTELSAPISAMTWRPDGLVLAVGLENGKIVLYDMETASIDSTIELFGKVHSWEHKHGITALSWTNIPSSSSKQNDRTCYFVMNPAIPSVESSNKFPPVLALDDDRHILVSGDANGDIIAWAYGAVCILCIKANMYGSSGIPVSNLFLMEDLSSVVLANNKSIQSIELRDLGENQSQLFVVAHHVREIQNLLRTAESTLKQINSEWNTGTRIFEAKMRLLSPAYAKYATKECPQAHMYLLLCSGLGFPALINFFAQDLQEQGIQRMQKAFTHACHSIQTLVHEQLQVAANNILFRLCELRGLTQAHAHHFQLITPEHIDGLVNLVRGFIVQIERLQIGVRETEVDYSLLFTWFNSMILAQSANRKPTTKMNSLDTQRLARFLFRASSCAKAYQAHIGTSSDGIPIEVTFGNSVSEMLGKCQWKPKTPFISSNFASDIGENRELGEIYKAIELSWCTHLLEYDLSNKARLHQLSTSVILELPIVQRGFQLGYSHNFTIVGVATEDHIVFLRYSAGMKEWQSSKLGIASLESFCLYTKAKHSTLAILQHQNNQDMRLALVSLDNLTFSSLRDATINVLDDSMVVKSRILSSSSFTGVVGNGTRGVLAVFAKSQRHLVLYDAEEDDDNEEDKDI